MKNFYLILTALLFASAAEAQSPGDAGMNADTLAGRVGVTDSQGREILVFSEPARDDNTFSLSVLGMNIDFGKQDKSEDYPMRLGGEGRFSLDVFGEYGFGFAFLSSVDYSMYPDRPVDFLDLDHGKSWQLKWNILDFLYDLNPRKTVTLGVGLGLKSTWYSFRNRYELVRNDGVIQPQYIPEERGKYRSTNYSVMTIYIPLYARVKLCDKFYFKGGAYGEFTIQQQTMVRKPKVYTVKDFGARTFQMGLSGQLEYGVGFVYFDYGLSSLFRSGVGPKAQPFSAGIGIRFSALLND